MSYILCATTAAEVFTYIGFVLVALIALMLMIIVHELGHYTAGKLLGFKIDEFAIGFGPALFKRTNKKTGEVFTIRPFPIGGFCAFHGEDEDGKEDKDAFNNQKAWKRLIVLFAGAFMNFISAIFIITIFFSVYGQVLPTVVKSYDVNGYENVFQAGDAILAVNGKQVNILTNEDVTKAFSKLGDTAEFKILRNGKSITVSASRGDYTLDEEDVKEGEDRARSGFGITYGASRVKLPFFLALGRSFGFCFFIVFKILASLGALITGQIGLESAGGTITVIGTIAQMSQMGFDAFLYVVAIISANLAVMNLLPVPALDGSRMVFTLIEMIFRKPVPRKVEAVIHTVGLILLLLLAVFLDIFHLAHV